MNKLKLIKMNAKKWILVLYITVIIIGCVNGLSTIDDRDGRKLFGGYRITPKFCRASRTLPRSDPRSHGPTMCMFNHECNQRHGEVVGACMDGFLFGTCCQLPLSIESPAILENPSYSSSNNAAALSYESYGHNNQLVNNKLGNFNDNNNDNNNNNNNNNNYQETIDVDNSNIYIENKPLTTPSTYYPSSTLFYLPPSSTPINYNHQIYNEELPTLLTGNDNIYDSSNRPQTTYQSNNDFTSNGMNYIANTLLNDDNTEFSHSDITHPAADTILMENDDYDQQNGYEYDKYLTTSTEKPTRITYPKPLFKPKPTETAAPAVNVNDNEYVLVHTITHENPNQNNVSSDITSSSNIVNINGGSTNSYPATSTKPQNSMSENDIESIESIILMLNDTKTGPQYNTMSSSTDSSTIEKKTNSIDHEKYGSTSFYITTKLPASTSSKAPPSTSYVYSMKPTIRPMNVQSTISSSYGTISSGDIDSNRITIPSSTLLPPISPVSIITKKPQVNLIKQSVSTSTLPPSTSYVYSSSTSKRPSTNTGGSILHNVVMSQSTKRPSTIHKTSVKRPSITKTTQKLPSTSYVTGPTTPRPTKRPSYIQSTSPTKRVKITTAKPQSPLAPQPTKQIPINTNILSSTTPAPTVIVLGPYDQYGSSTTESSLYDDDYVVQSKPLAAHKPSNIRDDFTYRPTPTVHITPKPTAVNLVTSSAWTQKPILNDRITTLKVPSTSYVYNPIVTQRPGTYSSSTMSNYDYQYVSSTNLHNYHDGQSSINDDFISNYNGGATLNQNPHKEPISSNFYDPGYYYGPTTTMKPQQSPSPIDYQNTVTSQPIYTMIDNIDNNNNNYNNNNNNNYMSSSPVYPVFFGSPATYDNNFNKKPMYTSSTPPYSDIEVSTFNEEYVNEMNNFPPVRNPNLNMSATFGTGIKIEDYDISTPSFVDDQALNDKMGLLVSKIVESLQDNFNNLEDVVFDNNNITDAQSTITQGNPKPTTIKKPITTRKPSTVTKKTTVKPSRITTRKPVTSKPVTSSVTNAKPNVRPSTTITKRPITTKTNTTTTKRPISQITRKTTRKPATTLSNTTKRPITKATTKRPITSRPTKRIKTTVATTTTTTTTAADEIYEEDGNVSTESQEQNEIGDDSESTTGFFDDKKRIYCGIRPHVKSARIVGGKGATFGEFPWQVLVRESTWLGLFTKNKCGGVLISKNYAMTAAHCQPGFLASLVAVLGEFDMTGDLEKKRSITKNVKRVVVHREYDAATFENDLALLELESEVHYDTHIVPICMPPDVADFTGRMATVSGWGRLKYGGGVPSILQEVQVPVIENGVCEEMFHTAGHKKKILPSFLCAGYANGQKDSCEGDSGGPLVLERSDGRWELVGTVSHGIKCAAPYLPGVYMRTTYFKPWIQSVTGMH